LETFVVNESVIIYNNSTPKNPLVYLVLQDISSIHITGKILVIDENTVGRLFLEFISIADAKQAFSLLNYVSNNTGIIIQNLSPQIDLTKPIVYFYQTVDDVPIGTSSGTYIEFNGGTAGPYNTTYGLTFSTSISLDTYGSSSNSTLVLTKNMLTDLLIGTVSDNRDGAMILSDSNLTLIDYSSTPITMISSTGTYSLGFIISDIAGNSIDTNTKITLSITT
jgi:hypothetical protein